MKSVNYIKRLTYVGATMILLLQGIWMTNAYRLTQKQLQAQINDIFDISVYKELAMRMNTPSFFSSQTESGIIFDAAEYGAFSQEIDFNQDISIVLQNHLSTQGKKLSFQNLDSIFHSEIARHKIYNKFIINRLNPNTGEALETTGPAAGKKLRGAMASEIIPIRMDGSEGVQVLLASPHRTVFRQMLFAPILSLLLLFFVGYALFFMMHSFSEEQRLRRLQNDFSHALMHNMASPLQTIYQVNALMKNDRLATDAEKRNKHIDLAQQQIVNLQALTNRILTLANAEEAKLKIQPETVNLNDMVRSLTEKFSVQAKKNVHFKTCFSPGEIILTADGSLLQNAIGNLIDNAIKYSGEVVNIYIRGEQNKSGTFIYVKDDGYGISAKDRKKIFASFERGKAVKRNEARGFGLGLSYVKKAMEAHDGAANLFSEEGKGSEFVLYLPESVKNNFDKTGKDDKDTLS